MGRTVYIGSDAADGENNSVVLVIVFDTWMNHFLFLFYRCSLSSPSAYRPSRQSKHSSPLIPSLGPFPKPILHILYQPSVPLSPPLHHNPPQPRPPLHRPPPQRHPPLPGPHPPKHTLALSSAPLHLLWRRAGDGGAGLRLWMRCCGRRQRAGPGRSAGQGRAGENAGVVFAEEDRGGRG